VSENSFDDAALLRSVERCFDVPIPSGGPKRIGVAVSGGGDSMALLDLLHLQAQHAKCEIAAVTVDHGLRRESAEEAQAVARFCQRREIAHDILTWCAPTGAGNLAAAAREGRYALMAQWAQSHGVVSIALGHTADDVAETLLMRLGRAAGLDGLAAMQQRFERHSIRWQRPLLHRTRAELRAYLRNRSLEWADDPSNEDTRYTRTNARAVLPLLSDLGISAASLCHSADALAHARDALAHYTRSEAAQHIIQETGDLILPYQLSPPLPPEIERRLRVAALQWVGCNPYPARRTAVAGLADDLLTQSRVTIAGCLVTKSKERLRITREYNAVKTTVCASDALWDGRWRLEGPHAPDVLVRALGTGVNQLPDWRATGVPRATLMASPAVWRGNQLVAAPVAGHNPRWSAQIVADFTSFLLSH
jgi:tRNA(Ile)-lysidine synthase